MTKAKFAKGSWSIEDSRVILCDGVKVAYVCPGTKIPLTSAITANANLIKSAPEMYKELEELVEWLKYRDDYKSWKERVEKLLSSARGEK